MELFNDFFEPAGAWEMLSRTGHILSGITWIGLLYFFNFVQTPAFAGMSADSRSEAMRMITLRALWWFRYAALLTFLFGISIVGVQGDETDTFLSGQRGTSILTGMLLGITMFLNVWGVIWRNQKVIIGSAERVAQGGEADPRAAALAKPSARASRTNTLFSIPMLFFMVFAPHGGFFWREEIGSTIVYWLVVLVIWAFIEASALGLIGGYDSAFNKLVFDDHRNTIIAGFVLWAVLYFVGWEIILKAA
ncbi:MAG: urate hydroxylase PuuD [Acidimicrobiales bacterium]